MASPIDLAEAWAARIPALQTGRAPSRILLRLGPQVDQAQTLSVLVDDGFGFQPRRAVLSLPAEARATLPLPEGLGACLLDVLGPQGGFLRLTPGAGVLARPEGAVLWRRPGGLCPLRGDEIALGDPARMRTAVVAAAGVLGTGTHPILPRHGASAHARLRAEAVLARLDAATRATFARAFHAATLEVRLHVADGLALLAGGKALAPEPDLLSLVCLDSADAP